MGAGRDLAHVGSTAVREAIEEVQPLVSLHGHIHESRATTRLGRTLDVYGLSSLVALDRGEEKAPGVVWAGSEPSALWRSEDRGETFELVRGLWDHPHREQWGAGFGGQASTLTRR